MEQSVTVKHGVYEEEGKYNVYVNGEKVYSARLLQRAEVQFKRATKQIHEQTSNVVSLKSEQDQNVYIPTVDPLFVPFGNYNYIYKIIETKQFCPVFVTGPSGNGKSSMIEQACAQLKRGFIRVQITKDTDEDQLIGTKTLEDGNIKIVEGPVLLAMRQGAILLLDEISIAQPDSIMTLQSILEGKPYYFKLKNEIIYPAPGFNIIATDNTKGRGSDNGKYIGTKFLNEAFLERFAVTLEQEYPTKNTELKIIMKAMKKHGCVDEVFAKTLIKWAEAIRKAYDEGAIDDLITTRRLLQIIQIYSIFKDKKLAVQLGINRFDNLTKASFMEVFEKIDPSEAVAEDFNTEIPVQESNFEQSSNV